MRTIRPLADGSVEIIDQTRLPWSLEHVRLTRLEEAARAIADMQVRGAPLIGVTAAWGLALALRDDPSDAALAGRAPRCRRRAPRRSTLPGPGADRSVPSRRLLADDRARPRPARRRHRRGGRRRLPRHRRAWRRTHRRHRRAQGRRAGRNPHPLQRRLAGHRGLGDGPGPDLCRPGARDRRPRLGRRDAAAQPGRGSHRLRARPAGRGAHRHRRQCRRPSDAARASGPRAGRAPTGSPAPATPPTRSAPI